MNKEYGRRERVGMEEEIRVARGGEGKGREEKKTVNKHVRRIRDTKSI